MAMTFPHPHLSHRELCHRRRHRHRPQACGVFVADQVLEWGLLQGSGQRNGGTPG